MRYDRNPNPLLRLGVALKEITSQAIYVAYNVIPRRVRVNIVAVEKQ
jgi:hypothetical protein